MIKKMAWLIPTILAGSLAVGGGVAAGYIVNSNSTFQELRKYTALPSKADNDGIIQSYLSSAVNGSKLLSLPGFTHTTPLTQALSTTSNENSVIYKYMNNLGFLLLDDKYGFPIFNKSNQLDNSVSQPIWSTHVASAQFRTDLGSFIVGIALGEFLNEYQYYFTSNDNKLTYGTYGGDNFSSVTGYMGGLQRGIEWFNTYIVPYAHLENGNPYKNVEQIFVGESYGQNFSGTFNSNETSKALINNFLDKNVDALMPVAGDQTAQATSLIKQRNLRTIVIGVDSANELDTNSNLNLYTSGYESVNGSNKIGGTNNIIQFSSLKRLDQITPLIVNNINNGKVLPDGDETIGGLGYHSLGTVENNSVGISEAGYQYFIRAMKMYVASFNVDPDTPPESFSSNQQNVVSPDYITQIFKVPNDDANINIPNTDEYKQYYTDELYKKYVNVIVKNDTFIALNDSVNKEYKILNGSIKCLYTDLPNTGSQMMPLNIDELDSWYDNTYKNSSSYSSLSESDHSARLNSLRQWFQTNNQTVNVRKSFNLLNALDSDDWKDNNSIIKIALNSPTIALMDKSFNESAFNGLILYWKSKGINIKV